MIRFFLSLRLIRSYLTIHDKEVTCVRCCKYRVRPSLRTVWVVLGSAVIEAVEIIPAVFPLDRAHPGIRPCVLSPWHSVPSVNEVGEGLAHPLCALAH